MENTHKGFQPYRFSPEELQVIQECGRESFFQRCLPLGVVLGSATYYGVKSGYLKANPRFGATPKVMVASILGYFLGKITYQAKCVERLMQLPNSPIAEILRQKKKANIKDRNDSRFSPAMSLASFVDISSSDVYTDSSSSGHIDLDISTIPQYSDLDDSFRPSLDNASYGDTEMPSLQKHVKTYEELRKQNRAEYVQKRTGVSKNAPESISTPLQPTIPSPNILAEKNKYGDDIE